MTNSNPIKIKYLARLYTGDSIPDSEKSFYENKEIPYISSKDIDVNNNFVDYCNGMSTDYVDKFKIAKKGSTLLCIEGGSAGRKIAILDRKVSFVNKLCCFEPYHINPGYLFYSLQSWSFLSSFYKNLLGMIGGVSVGELKDIKIPVVLDSHSQQRIASYLKDRINSVNQLIGRESQLVEDLRSYKRSLINDALTKGITPRPITKECGIDWMGKIKSSYSLKRMKYVAFCSNGLTYSPDDVVEDGSGVLVLRSSNIQNGVLDFEDCVYVKMSDIPMVRSGDTLICSRNGSAALIGKNAYVEEDMKYSFGAFMMIARPKKGINGKYLFYLMNSNVFDHYLSTFLTTTINQLTKGNFNNMVVPVCEDYDEQLSIVAYLNKKCEELNKLIRLKELKIEKLKEYKKSLIYECVTGRREV